MQILHFSPCHTEVSNERDVVNAVAFWFGRVGIPSDHWTPAELQALTASLDAFRGSREYCVMDLSSDSQGALILTPSVCL